MSSKEDLTHKKRSINDTGKESKKLDPKDLEAIRKNIKSNEEERRESSAE